MTPLSRVLAGTAVQVPTVSRPHAHGSTASQSPEKPTVRVADRYVGPPASDYSTMEDVVKALRDERQLFGKGYGEYEYQDKNNGKNNRYEKFLKITMAILSIKEYLRSGDGKDARVAVNRIKEWLLDPVLLQDEVVGTPVRRSLIWVLNRAPKGQKGLDEGIKAIIDALSNNYSVNAVAHSPTPAPNPVNESETLSEHTVSPTSTPPNGVGQDNKDGFESRYGALVQPAFRPIFKTHPSFILRCQMFVTMDSTGAISSVSYKGIKLEGSLPDNKELRISLNQMAGIMRNKFRFRLKKDESQFYIPLTVLRPPN